MQRMQRIARCKQRCSAFNEMQMWMRNAGSLPGYRFWPGQQGLCMNSLPESVFAEQCERAHAGTTMPRHATSDAALCPQSFQIFQSAFQSRKPLHLMQSAFSFSHGAETVEAKTSRLDPDASQRSHQDCPTNPKVHGIPQQLAALGRRAIVGAVCAQSSLHLRESREAHGCEEFSRQQPSPQKGTPDEACSSPQCADGSRRSTPSQSVTGIVPQEEDSVRIAFRPLPVSFDVAVGVLSNALPLPRQEQEAEIHSPAVPMREQAAQQVRRQVAVQAASAHSLQL